MTHERRLSPTTSTAAAAPPTTGDDDHIRDLIEQVLFTTPGERVNRPDFGSGLLQLVFAPNSAELAAATAVPRPGRAAAVARRPDRGRGGRGRGRRRRAAGHRPLRRPAHRRDARPAQFTRGGTRVSYFCCDRDAPRTRSRGSRARTASTTWRCSTATRRPAHAPAHPARPFRQRSGPGARRRATSASTGGERVRDIRRRPTSAVDAGGRRSVPGTSTVDQPGDFSTYTLRLVQRRSSTAAAARHRPRAGLRSISRSRSSARPTSTASRAASARRRSTPSRRSTTWPRTTPASAG